MGSSRRWVVVLGLLTACSASGEDPASLRAGEDLRPGGRRWCYAPATADSVDPIAAQAVANGVVVASSRSSDQASAARPWLLGLDDGGEPLWSREDLQSAAHQVRIHDLAPGPAGATVLVAGLRVAEPGARAQAWIAELDAETGALLRERSYADAGGSLAAHAIVGLDGLDGPDGGLALAGAAGSQAWLARLDAELEPIWERRFERGGAARGDRLVPLADERLAIAGTAVAGAPDPITGLRPTHPFVRVYEHDGALALDLAPAGLGPPASALIDAVAWESGLLVSATRGRVFPSSRSWAITPAGALLELDPSEPGALVEALAEADGAVVLAGAIDRPSGPRARWLARVTPGAPTPSWTSLGPPGEWVSISAALAEPAIYAAARSPRATGGSDATICKFNE